ncbi:thioester reductase domain-containing protein [Nocardia stercoris]|uniref:NAD-dependent epimerase/dehydratase family protein n=1 Tax=Nocardia stercoris TaxID=2483361 RepID=A0A3M2L9G4_9NOCA|nr:thioester reductase domain-containing protein [Nocardia stercoris]RMI33686.1 NAD-dependent epimerase/dehydratase family protein [Nocardia stercoris]
MTPNSGNDNRSRALALESGGAGMDIAALLAAAAPRRATPEPATDPAVPQSATGWTVAGLAAVITEIANRKLAEPIDSETDLFEAGATSVAAVEFVAALIEEHGVELSLDDVFADARPRRLAERWLTRNGFAVEAPPADPGLPAVSGGHLATPPVPSGNLPAAIDIDEDLALASADIAGADRLPWVGPPPLTAPRRVLLTGATGFLGSHLLLDLLRHSDAHVVCLVRGEDDAAATERLGKALRSFYLPWSSEIRRRITVLAGDVRRPRLGLSAEQWDALAQDIDAIVNVAAAVDFLRGYPSLRQANVLGPLTLAELAMTGTIKPLHHISSVAVFNEVAAPSMGEDDPVAHLDRLGAGYDKTKWAAEALLRRARERGLVVTFLRPAGIGGHPRTGAHNPHDLSSAFLAAFSRFRTMPAFRYLNVAPVDWVSRVTAAIVGEPQAWGRDYHLTGVPSTVEDVRRDMMLGGMNVVLKDWPDWRDDTLARIRREGVAELEFLARMLESPTAQQLCEASMTAPAATMHRTRAFVAAHGLPPAVRYDARAQQRTFERLADLGVARLPDRADAPYLWFPETLRGTVTDGDDSHPCELALTLSIASMHQLVTDRRVDVAGELRCAALHPDPLTVERGDVWVRPQQGVPTESGLRHPLLRYRLELRDSDGGRWWMEGHKTARARRDLWRQARALRVDIGRAGAAARLSGEVVVPADSYVPDQIDGIRTNPELSEREQRLAKLVWLGWFGSQVGRGLAQPLLRAAAELLDLGRDAATKELR